MVSIKQLPSHRRPREKLLEKGPEGLTDAELLAVILRTGVRGKSAIQLAKFLLGKYSLNKLWQVSLEDLKQVKGLGLAKAAQLMAAFELAKRAQETDSELPLTSPERVINLLNGLKTQKKEHFVALYLNARHRLISQETISVGHLTGSLVHPREVFKPAIECAAASIIVAHNHPSNDPQPSTDDREITNKLVKTGEILDIKILDHLIISQDGWVSLKALGYLS